MIRPGLALTAFSPAYPDQGFSASVRTVGSRIDPVTRAATVRAHIVNSSNLIQPGMLMTVKLETSNRQALMVPETALVQRAGETFVYTVSPEKRAVVSPVRHGKRRDGWVEIIEGLKVGDAVVSEGVIKIRPGAQIRTQGEGFAGGGPGQGRPAPGDGAQARPAGAARGGS